MNAINWFELPATDMDRAIEFYSTILGQPLRKGEYDGVPHGFFPVSEGSVGGALVVSPQHIPSDKGVVIYLNTGNDLDGVLSRVEAAGGSVTLQKLDISPMGWMALIRDTEGNQVGLHQPPAQG